MNDKIATTKKSSSLLFQPNYKNFKVCPFSFDGANSPVAQALQCVGSLADSNAGYILYNDAFPNGKTITNFGHTKGFLFWNQQEVWWVIHSVPKWPQSLSPLTPIAENQHIYGQSLCIMKNPTTSLNDIVQQLLVNTANVYDSKVPDQQKALSWMSVLLAKRKSTWSARAGKTSIKNFFFASKSQTFQVKHFAKGPNWGHDLYDNLISPTLNIQTISETWGRPLMPSTVFSHDVLEIKWPGNVVEYPEQKDHSKWAISIDNKSLPWAFVLDINRMKTQFRRGGGGVGFQSQNLWSAFNSIVAKTDLP